MPIHALRFCETHSRLTDSLQSFRVGDFINSNVILTSRGSRKHSCNCNSWSTETHDLLCTGAAGKHNCLITGSPLSLSLSLPQRNARGILYCVTIRWRWRDQLWRKRTSSSASLQEVGKPELQCISLRNIWRGGSRWDNRGKLLFWSTRCFYYK